MADLTVVNPDTLASTLQPVSNALSASDRFPVTRGRKYMIRLTNGDASSKTLRIDDPNSVLPPGAEGPEATFADVPVVVPNGVAPANQRVVTISADRFADANGWVNLTVAAPAAFTAEIYGPLPV